MPTEAWIPWKFSKSPLAWWKQLAQLVRGADPVGLTILRYYLNELGFSESLQYDRKDTLKGLKQTQVNRLAQLGEVSQLLALAFHSTGHTIHNTSSHESPTLLKSPKSRRKLLERLLEANNPYELYKLTYAKILQLQGSSHCLIFIPLYLTHTNLGDYLLRLYNGSAASICMGEFPEHPWQPWKFKKSPHKWWAFASTLANHGDIVAETVLDAISDSERTLLKRDTTQDRRLDFFGKSNRIRRELDSNSSKSKLKFGVFDQSTLDEDIFDRI